MYVCSQFVINCAQSGDLQVKASACNKVGGMLVVKLQRLRAKPHCYKGGLNQPAGVFNKQFDAALLVKGLTRVWPGAQGCAGV